MSNTFLTLDRAGDAVWTMTVTDGLAAGRGDHRFLFGGAGLACAVAAMEQSSGRPAIWATAQYLSYVRPGATVEIAVDLATVGKAITQARATLSNAGREIITATAALGHRDGPSDQWAQPIPVPAPEDCDEIAHWNSDVSIGGRFRFRPAHGYFGYAPTAGRQDDGRLLFWMRPVEDVPIDRTVLAVMADFFTPGIRNATGQVLGGNSLDNTIRYGKLVETDWVLCEVFLEAIANGFTLGTMRIFGRDGTLMASASQSMILRDRSTTVQKEPAK